MYVGLGQLGGGYNPCGQGYAFVNFQCVHDPNCDFSGGSGIGVCPEGYHSPAVGTSSAPASSSEVADAYARALLAPRTSQSDSGVSAPPPSSKDAPASSSGDWLSTHLGTLALAAGGALVLWLMVGGQ